MENKSGMESLDQRLGINGKRTYDFKKVLLDFGLYMKQQKDGKVGLIKIVLLLQLSKGTDQLV